MSIDPASAASQSALMAASNAAKAQDLAKVGGSQKVSTPTTGGKENNKDVFMKLLVAQLKYQDPSKPVDSSTFIAQTATFSQLETLEKMAKTDTSVLAAQQRMQASSLVGMTVSYTGADGKPATGTVTSAAFNGTTLSGTGGEPVLTVDGRKLQLSEVSSVDVPKSPTTGPSA
ncbi:hypothetical protein NUM3379_01110 [Kineococcus sp. NUM-3379]